MKLIQLFEKAYNDYNFYREANNIVLQTYEYLHNCLNENKNYVLPKLHGYSVIKVSKFNSNYPTLQFIIKYMNGSLAGYSHVNDNVDVIYISLNTSDICDIINFFKEHRMIVVHELIHYFDFNRTQSKITYDPDNISRSEYVNNPMEYNALYHEIADPLLELLYCYKEYGIDAMKDDLQHAEYTNDFNTYFKNRMKNLSDLQCFYDEMNVKYKTKLTKRLYQLHHEIYKLLNS